MKQESGYVGTFGNGVFLCRHCEDEGAVPAADATPVLCDDAWTAEIGACRECEIDAHEVGGTP